MPAKPSNWFNSTQDPAEEKQKKAAEARWHDTPKPVVRKCWKEDEGGKERYLQNGYQNSTSKSMWGISLSTYRIF